jgi:L-aspartate oxidase
MEFVQFHPTTLYNPSERPAFLITEALRGAGAVLKDWQGNEFMKKYDERGSLAPRDIVARAIDHELKISGEHHVFLDARHIDKSVFFNHFPNIYSKCLSIGIDATKDMIPVVPAAHYSCGGISVDKWGCTTIAHLYALGECASTGLHGANRLASNSLLESLVFSHRACVHASECLSHISFENNIKDWNAEGTVSNEEMILVTQNIRELQSIMSYYVGIVRSDQRLERAFNRLNIIYHEAETLYQHSVVTKRICELRNMVCTAYLITRHAMQRKESIGLHYSIDYPPKD